MIKVVSNKEQTATGPLQITFDSDGTPLDDYKLYGTADGAGVETENLLNPDENKQGDGYMPNTILTPTGTLAANSFWTSELIPIKPNTKYWVFRNLFRATRSNSVIKFYVSTTEYLSYDLIPGHLTDVEYSADNCSSFTTPSSANYLRISVDKNSSMNCIVESEECPVSYIPYGYKLPMTVTSEEETENLVPEIRINNGWRPGYLNSANGAYVANNAYGEWLSPFIELKSITAVSILYKPVDNNPSLSIYFFDANDEFISSRSTTVDGKVTFDSFPSAAAKICYAYRTWHKTEQEIIQNEDWTCLVEGSTPPDHYIPYRYSTTTPIYIGDSKLGEEEYVNYEEQKIYKRTENLFDKKKTNPNNNSYLDASGAVTLTSTGQWTVSDYIPVKQGNYIATGLSRGGKDTYCCIYDSDKIFVRSELLVASTPLLFEISEGESFVRLSIRLLSEEIEAAMFTESPAPETYVPYLQPTDPPVALPELSTYQGENTLSCSEELGDESQITYVGPVEETITKIMRTADDGQGNVTEHVLYKEGS